MRPSLRERSLCDRAATYFLMTRVDGASRTARERRLFRAVIRRAYEDVLPLEALYAALPGVLAGDPDATATFMRLVERETPRAREAPHRAAGRPARGAARTAGRARRSPPRAIDRRPAFLISPAVMAELALGAQHIARGDPEAYTRYVAGIRRAWERSVYLNQFFRDALSAALGKDGDRLRDTLALIGRRGTPDPRPDGPGAPGRGRDWPPEPDDTFIEWPPDDPVPGHPGDYDFTIGPCIDAAIDAIGGIEPGPAVGGSADGITGLDPSHICQPTRVRVLGAFPEQQPAHVEVVVGTSRADVVSWTSSAIMIDVLDGTASGCVGFVDTEAQRLAATLGARTQRRLDAVATELGWCVGHQVTLRGGASSAGTPDTGVNRLLIGRPVVLGFTSNGEDPQYVEQGEPLILTWDAANGVEGLALEHLDEFGPDPPATLEGNVCALGPFTGNRPARTSYRLSASNRCGSATAETTVWMNKTPALRILGVEIVQVIQRFSFAEALATNNSVPLVAGKRTVARVYVDSGRRDGFQDNRVAYVVGSVIAFPAAAGRGYPANGPVATNGAPYGGTYEDWLLASPPDLIERRQFGHTLNFVLPTEHLAGDVALDVRVWARGHEGDPREGWHAFLRTPPVSFRRRRSVTFQPVLVRDAFHGIDAPSMDDYATTVRQARIRLPLAEDAITFRGEERIDCLADLNTGPGWEALAAVLAGRAQGDDDNVVWTAIVPDRDYGMGGFSIDLSRELHRPGVLVVPATHGASFAHEFGHVLHIGHARSAPDAPFRPGDDPDLPDRTEDLGVNTLDMTVVAQSRELMVPDAEPSRWPSIVTWGKAFDMLVP